MMFWYQPGMDCCYIAEVALEDSREENTTYLLMGRILRGNQKYRSILRAANTLTGWSGTS